VLDHGIAIPAWMRMDIEVRGGGAKIITNCCGEAGAKQGVDYPSN
jgi:hypothetical protein